MDESDEGFSTVKRKSSDPGQIAKKKVSNEPLAPTSRDATSKEEVKPRAKAYHTSFNRALKVFFMPRNKPLDVRSITASIYKKFLGVLDVIRLHPKKLRVTAKDLVQANAIVADPD